MVNADSVIPTWLNTWDSALYTSLTSQENTSYTGTTPNIEANWKPLFTNLATALNNWKAINRQSSIQNFLLNFYGYYTLQYMYGLDSSLVIPSSATSIFNLNGFTAACKSRANNYYNDFASGASAKMTSDISTINAAVTAENTNFTSLISSLQSITLGFSFNSLFQNISATQPFPGKAAIATEIFNTMGYKLVFQTLNVGTLTLPPGV